MSKITLNEVLNLRESMYIRSRELVAQKGADYNRTQQEAGDTLFNLRVCRVLGIVDTETQGVLVRLSDKLMRLASLTRDPSADPAVKNESVLDTVADVHNYVDYLLAFYLESRGELQRIVE